MHPYGRRISTPREGFSVRLTEARSFTLFRMTGYGDSAPGQ